MGGDYAPGPILEGCLEAISRFPINIKFVGKIEKVKDAAEKTGLAELLENEIENNRLELIDSGEPIGMNEEATAVRKRKNASINVAMDLVRNNKAEAVYSAGNSGAMMASAIFRIGRLKGIERPAIGALFPTRDQTRPVLVLDVGANTDCKPSYLHQFALLGNIYAKDVLQVKKPRIGLLNIGEEECKGNDLSLKTFELLSSEKSFDFGGNCEGRDVLSGNFDVVVCDGFTGNILLKFLESVGGVLLDTLRSELPRGRRGKVGSAFLNTSSSPPTITVSIPPSAPACPPEIGASKKLNPLSLAFLFNSLDTSADTVELSIKIDPALAVSNNPFSPVATSLKSSSLPTHVKMKSAPSAASAGVLAILPLYSPIHFSALDLVLLKTVTLCPAFDI